MISDHSTIEEYAEHIKDFSLDELFNIASCINKYKHPDRYDLLVKRIEALQKNAGNSLPVADSSLKQNYFTSPTNAAEPAAPIRYIILGILLPLSFWFWGFIANQIDFIKYRPWIAVPIAFITEYLFFIGIMIFVVIACKKLLFWPLIESESLRETSKSFVKQLLLFIPIRFAIGLIVLIIGAVLNKSIEEPHFMRFAAYGPNNWTVIIFLFSGFTIWPVVEEFFFRGFLYNALKTRTPLGFAVIIQAVIFSLEKKMLKSSLL
jgi:membrane protease YdiL (CAAX protease family)